MIHTRRKFLTGLGSLLAAPAIVQAGNLMPVKALPKLLTLDEYVERIVEPLYGRSPAMGALGDLKEFRRMWNAISQTQIAFGHPRAQRFLMEPK